MNTTTRRRTSHEPERKQILADAHSSLSKAATDLESLRKMESLGKIQAEIDPSEKQRMMAEVLQRISKLPVDRLERVKAALDCIENASGFLTPGETFVVEILQKYAWDILTPDSAMHHLEEFRTELAQMTKDAAAFVRAHPEALKTALDAMAQA